MRHYYLKNKKIYSYLDTEDITNADYMHPKRFCKDFEIKYLGEYNDLYIQSNTLLLPDFFENFQNICLEIYELSHSFSFHIRISLASSFKKD